MIHSFLSTIYTTLFTNSHTTAQNLKSLTFQLISTPIHQLTKNMSHFNNPAQKTITFYQPILNYIKYHKTNKNNKQLKPDLNEKHIITTTYLIKTLLKPSKKIKKNFKTITVRTLNKNLITNILTKETNSYLLINQIEQPKKPLKILKNNINQ